MYRKPALLLALAAALLALPAVPALAASEKAPADQVRAKVDQATRKSLDVLTQLSSKLPAQSLPAIQKAMAAITLGHDRALAHLMEGSAGTHPTPPDAVEPPDTGSTTPPADGGMSPGDTGSGDDMDAGSPGDTGGGDQGDVGSGNPGDTGGGDTGGTETVQAHGLDRAAQAIQEGTAKALATLEGLKTSVPERALKGLNRATERIAMARDHALGAIAAAAAKPE
ncbi:MAG TPA: hypothetical protein VNI57_09070, partial [Candidatus Saccharimonadales bacterium]|nr:hypothetical protein [Candidatus Saccharimonadales bacterium]